MYCSICGAQSTQGLNYCKRCGANLASPTPMPANEGRWSLTVFPFLFAAIVCVAGFIALFVTIVELAGRNIDPRMLLGITAFGGATVFGVVGMFTWLLMKLTGASAPSHRIETPHPPDVSDQPQIAAPPLSMPSVTENTTRNFDPFGARERETGR